MVEMSFLPFSKDQLIIQPHVTIQKIEIEPYQPQDLWPNIAI